MDLFEAAEAKKGAETPEALTVSAVTALIKRSLEETFPSVWVVGEVSNLSRAASGHVYLTLKDEAAEIGAVIWRGTAERIPFRIEDGQEVIVHGRIAVYERRGRYQVVVTSVQPKGVGALQLAFLQLKETLEKEGLFDPAHKKPLPFLPGTIGIVTSPAGAAIRDMLTMIEGRFPRVHVLIYPVAVQGDQAAPQIAAALDALNRTAEADVIIVGRGGGSLEDLWPFNEEAVARAIYRSAIPVISAVGHEVDVSISDWVADERALTPTKAGEMVVPSEAILNEKLEESGRRLARSLLDASRRARERLKAIAGSYAMRVPAERVRQHQQRLDELAERIFLAASRALTGLREQVGRRAAGLAGLNPKAVLARGYTITTLSGSDRPLRSPREAPPGSALRTVLHEGELESTVDPDRPPDRNGAV